MVVPFREREREGLKVDRKMINPAFKYVRSEVIADHVKENFRAQF